MCETSVDKGLHVITVWYYTQSDLKENLKGLRVAYYDNSQNWDQIVSEAVDDMKGQKILSLSHTPIGQNHE